MKLRDDGMGAGRYDRNYGPQAGLANSTPVMAMDSDHLLAVPGKEMEFNITRESLLIASLGNRKLPALMLLRGGKENR